MLRYYLEVRFRSGPEEWFKKRKNQAQSVRKKIGNLSNVFFLFFSLFNGWGGGGIDPYQEKKINKGKNKEKG